MISSASVVALLFLSACASTVQPTLSADAQVGRDPSRLLIVDCLLPGQLRKLGGRISFLTPRLPTKASVSECEIRGGEYVAYDRANFATSLKIWLPQAESGDPKAQTLVGEIFEKGLGQIADPVIAAEWYRKAAAQGYSRARINLGYLYESGLGVERDLTKAMNLYRQAAGFEESSLEYVTTVQIASRKQQAARIPVLLEQVESANRELDSERSAYEKLQSDFLALEQQTEAIRKELATAATSGTVAPSESNPAETIQVGELLNEMQFLKNSLAESESKTRQLVSELEAQQQRTGSLRQQVTTTSSQLYETQDELAGQTREIEELQRQLVAQRDEDTTAANDREAQITAQLTSTMASRNALMQKYEQLQANQSSEAEKYAAELRVAEARENLLTHDLESTRSRLFELQTALTEKDADYRSQLSALGSSQSGLQSRIQQQQSTITELVENIESLTQINQEKNTDEALQADAELRELESELNRARSELAQTQSQLVDSERNSVEKLNILEQELQTQRNLVTTQNEKIGTLQRKVSDARATQAGPSIEAIPQVVATGPVIEIIDPLVTVHDNSLSIPVLTSSGSIDIVGRVSSQTDLLSFQINGGPEEVSDNGLFQHATHLDEFSRLSLAAVDNAGIRTAVDVELIRSSKNAALQESQPSSIDVSQVDFGEYHALIIGNGRYQAMPEINTAVSDATAMARVLENRFGFKTELLLDADGYDILAALNRKRDELSRRDNLLIYFAGHGEVGNGAGYWLPVDANPNDKSSWISNVSIASFIDSMDAKHVMIVADSVFSGTLSRSSLVRLSNGMNANERLRLYELVASSKVRTVLSSGEDRPFGSEEAADGRHSVFTSGVLKVLESTGDDVVMAHDMFEEIRTQLSSTISPSGSSLSPQYAPIKYSGHENGEFMFVPLGSQVGALTEPRDPLTESIDQTIVQ
ncbi:MAG: caspase family protein [Granulosicoccus sp.]